MTRHQPRCLGDLSPAAIVVAAGISLMTAGCCNTPCMMPESFGGGPAPALPTARASKAEAEAFKKKVSSDPFPTASKTTVPTASKATMDETAG